MTYAAKRTGGGEARRSRMQRRAMNKILMGAVAAAIVVAGLLGPAAQPAQAQTAPPVTPPPVTPPPVTTPPVTPPPVTPPSESLPSGCARGEEIEPGTPDYVYRCMMADERDALRVFHFWTPERLECAQPYMSDQYLKPEDLGASGNPTPDGPPGYVEPEGPTTAAAAAAFTNPPDDSPSPVNPDGSVTDPPRDSPDALRDRQRLDGLCAEHDGID